MRLYFFLVLNSGVDQEAAIQTQERAHGQEMSDGRGGDHVSASCQRHVPQNITTRPPEDETNLKEGDYTTKYICYVFNCVVWN